MIKKLEELTLKEYDKYKELYFSENFDIFEIMKFLGYDNPEDMPLNEFNTIKNEIINNNILTTKIKTEYNINGRLFHPVLMINEIKAAQFTDFQSIMNEGNLKEIMSIFMLPIKTSKRRFSFLFKNKEKKKVYKYGKYDVKEVQEYLYNNMKIVDVLSLSAFFLNLTYRLQPLFQNFLIKQLMKTKLMTMRKMKKMKRKVLKT